MAFQLKDFISITASMINRAKATQDKITDFNIGSVSRTLMESSAIEVEEFYQRVFAGLMEAIPVAIYKGFDFALIESAAARGYVVVSFGVPIEEEFTVPAGTIFVAPSTNIKYLSIVDVAVPVGATSTSIMVECSDVGTIGNVSVGSITTAQNYDFPLGSVVSNNQIVSGQDAESDEERKTRFASFILSLSRGTLASVKYAAASAVIKSSAGVTIEYVDRIGVSEEIGHVDLYVYGSGGIASDALVTEAQKLVDGYVKDDGTVVTGYRSAGIRATVLKMTERSVDVTLNVTMFPGYDLNTAVVADIRALLESEFANVDSGSVLYMSSLTDAALTAIGVKDAFVSNQSNIACSSSEVLRLGTLTVNEVNA